MPEKMVKTRNESDYPGLRKRKKTGAKRPILILVNFGTRNQKKIWANISLDCFVDIKVYLIQTLFEALYLPMFFYEILRHLKLVEH